MTPTTLEEAPRKESTIVSRNVLNEIARLKERPGKDIIVDGSATLVESLLAAGLSDEFRFLVEPFVMGTGRRFSRKARRRRRSSSSKAER